MTADLKARILAIITAKERTSFADLAGLMPDEFLNGDGEIQIPDTKIYLWASVTEAACSALWELVEAGQVEPEPCDSAIYYTCGVYPNLPVADVNDGHVPNYDTPHWLPTVFSTAAAYYARHPEEEPAP